MYRSVPEVRGGVSTVEDDALPGVHVLVDPPRPCLERSPVGLRRVELRVQLIAFLVVVLAAHVQCSPVLSII